MLAFHIVEKKVCNKSEHSQANFNEASIELFEVRLQKIKWYNLKTCNLAYNEFLDTFTSLHDDCFPRVKVKVKVRNPFRPCITKGLAKHLKSKKKIREKQILRKDPKL